jgi:hypothetical protein
MRRAPGEHRRVDHHAVDRRRPAPRPGRQHLPRPGGFLGRRAEGVADPRHLGGVDAELAAEAKRTGVARLGQRRRGVAEVEAGTVERRRQPADPRREHQRRAREEQRFGARIGPDVV